MTQSKWIGVDFDGTLTKTMNWTGLNDGRIGENIEPMVERVRAWLAEGREVRIVTARVARGFDPGQMHWLAVSQWSVKTFGQQLEVTAEKDPLMEELWDDRAIQLIPNTGVAVYGRCGALA